MLLAPFTNGGLAWPAGVVGVLWLTTVHHFGLGCLTHRIGLLLRRELQVSAVAQDVSIDDLTNKTQKRRL